MAPKRRASVLGAAVTIGRRSVRRSVRQSSSSSSSSSSSTQDASPSSPQVDLLAGKAITTGRKVDFNLFESEGFSIGRQIQEMGWEKVCSLDVPTYPALVREFYSDLCRGDGGLVSYVRGTRVVVTAESLGSLLDIPTVGLTASQHNDRGGALSRMLGREASEFEEVMANQLTLELRLLHNICGRILFPKIGRFEYVSERDILLMDCIITGQPVNLAGMMIGYMAEAASKKRSTLPYGMVLTLVFRSQGVMILENEPLRKLRYTDYYSISTIHRMGFRKVNGQWQRRGQEARVAEADFDHIEEVPGPSVAGPSAPGPSVAGPSTSSPPPPQAASSSGVFSDSTGFSASQLDQLRALMAEHDSQMRDEIRQLSSKLDMIGTSISSSADALSTELQKIYERMEVIAEGSRVYLDATGKLRREMDFAITQIEALIEGFKKSQKDEFMEVIGHLKRIVYKHV